MKTDFKEEWKHLNQYQMEAVLDESPACVVNANVGSGKTTVLIAKILYLHYEKSVPLEDMVVLTFTNKAADEIISRLRKKEPGLSREQVMGFGTFHSAALHLLKHQLSLEQTGWNREFTVISPDEEADLAAEVIAEQKLTVRYKNRLKKRLEQEYPGYVRGKESSRYRDDLFRLFPLLEEEKKRQNKMSFSDLLRVSAVLLRAGEWHPQWMIVDEVQDSDAQQIEFLEALKGKDTRLFAVGDPNQVIYSWRGTGENMFYLLKHRFAAKELSLPVNYRSSASILEAANRFLQSGAGIQSSRGAGGKIVVKNHYDPFQEAEYLAGRIRALHDAGRAYGEIAVFYRLQKQAELLKKVLERQRIPCEVSVRKTVRDIPVLNWLIKVLRFSVNPADGQMGMEALADPQYGETRTRAKAKKIIREQKWDNVLLYQRMLEFQDQEAWKKDTVPKAAEIFAYFGLREALHPTASAYQEDEKLVLRLLERICGYSREKGCGLIEGTREFVNQSALYGVNLLSADRDMDSAGIENFPGDTVKLMTLHASKGLEFETVFLIGMNQGLIPLHSQSFEQEEEERRLFFVGITRAKDELELSYYTNPGEPGISGEYSRYLRMLPPHLLEWEELRSEGEKRSNLQQLRREVQEQIREKKEQEQKEQEPQKNTAVKYARHPKYGAGILVSEDEMMVEVEFEGYGRKQFLKAFGEVTVEGE
ncbi:ATP-dependent helicase [Schaedlerella arabinosiphila]|uniref:DNA 3'-5' helicase n=1 Tax=Schaedlerella arabinosiphila TaxID=2044587 RepID=A0A426DJT4_9FIRM|nr:ATP-dependent helicase [Schaedlerella arabinosiphila]RRK33036.1 ATP-dependent helicase [Schaedlerella arabinosiphila]